MIGYLRLFIQILLMTPQVLKVIRDLKIYLDNVKKKNQLKAIDDIKNSTNDEDRNKALENLTSNL